MSTNLSDTRQSRRERSATTDPMPRQPDSQRSAGPSPAQAGREEPGFADALEQAKTAIAALSSGNPEPYINLLAESEDVTLFGAWVPIEKGYRQLAETARWVGGRAKGGGLVPEDIVAFASGDLGYTVGFERGEVAVADGPARPMTMRVTHIYRRVDGAWRLVHRHADLPPADQRKGMR